MSPSSKNRPFKAGRRDVGDQLIFAGLVVGMCIVPLSMDPGGYNLFGPAKAFMLSVSVALLLFGNALSLSRSWRGTSLLASQRSSWAIAVFLGLTLLSALPAMDPLSSMTGFYPEYQGVLALSAYVLFGISAARFAGDDHRWESILKLLVASAGIIAAFALLQELGLDPLEYRFNLNLARARSTLGNASNLGLYLVLVIPMLFALARVTRSKPWRLATILVLGASGLTLLWTDSRGAWLAMLAVAAVWLVFELPSMERTQRIRVMAGLAGASAAFLVLAVLFAPGVLQRAASSLDPSSGTQRWRVSVWGSAVQMSVDRPLLGWGPNSFRAVYPMYRSADLAEDASDAQLVANAHNILLHSSAESGPLAGLALGVWLVLFSWESWRNRRSLTADSLALAAVSSVIGGFVALQFHFLTLDTGPLLFALLGLSTSRVALSSQNVRSKDARDAPFSESNLTAILPWVAAVIGVVLILCTGGLIVADRATGRGMAAAQGGATWKEIQSEFAPALVVAGWDPSFSWAKGHAAVSVVQRSYDGTALIEGLEAIDSALGRLPDETRLQTERADLLLAAGLSSARDGESDIAGDYFDQAHATYESLIPLDPNNGVIWIGKGSALAGLGRWDEAAESYERGVALAGRSTTGWANLAVAYEQLGESEKAAAAKLRAEELDREMEDARERLR